MPVVQLTNIEKTFGRRTLFDQLNLSVERGERVGLIGANGSGKSTLFKLLVGEITADAGDVSISDGVKLGHLTQDPKFTPGSTVIDEAELAFRELHDLAHKMRDLEHAMADHTGDELQKTLDKYQTIQHEFDLGGGYVWHHKLEATLLGVGLGRETWEQPVETLSGGQRSRLALAQLLINAPDVLLLDEPTNHLDLAAIEWVEGYLEDFKGAVILISHDRFLLDRLSTRIAWLAQAKIKSYPGNYTAFTQQRELQELSQQRAYEEQQADIEKQKEFIRRFGAGQRSKEAKGREKRLNRLLISDQVIQQVDQQKKINLKISTDQRAGDRVLAVRELSKSYDQKQLWQSLKFEVKRGERIGIIGPNGSGKSTLLKVLLAEEDADGGDVRGGANLNLGYADQRLDLFDPENTVYEEISGGREEKGLQALRDVLA
ncbi:MAG: ATP-binding cassette, subfamily er 3, partial [Humisphaera sp.]|nr:ATP-binding cassette, subfamily er 3 [Humisphaera sp.]